jgi:hypothetical protein
VNTAAAANWAEHLPLVFLGLSALAREDDGTTTTQAVFSSPLILPGQFLDSPELPSKKFLKQFSKTLSAAEHSSTKLNTAAARNGVRQAGRPHTATPTALRLPLRRPSPLPALLNAAHWQQRGQGVERLFTVRGQVWAILSLSSSKILTPHPPLRLGREDTLARRRGGSIFWKMREIGLPSYSKICTLWWTPSCSNPVRTLPRRLRSPGSVAALPPPSASGIFLRGVHFAPLQPWNRA